MKAAITTQSWVSGRKGKAVWLAMIPALGLLCWTTIAPALAGGPAIGGAGPEGSWLATITLPDGKNVQSPVSYCAGGAMAASDPSVFPAKATAYHGTWMKTGRREFVFTAVGFIYDEVGALNPKGLSKIVIKETDTLEPDGDTYNGKGTVTIYGPDGAQVERFTVPAHAVRIKPE